MVQAAMIRKALAISTIAILSICRNISAQEIAITREIDVAKKVRQFPNLVGYLNTSLQNAPAPALAGLAREQFGQPEIVRCWLNLDEMWDYRTKKTDYNFRIGVDRYKDVSEKHRETWNREKETQIHYNDYLSAFSSNSKEIMLTIRRYEKDIITGKLPITMQDWKRVFKAGLKYYKTKFPNIRYVEVGNEYHLKGFAGATDEQYYAFYKLGYEAVNEINRELKLKGMSAILVGGPVTTGGVFLVRMNAFMDLYKKDKNPEKKLDFISWHEYTKPIYQTAFRERTVKDMLQQKGLNAYIPLFITEHDPFHLKEDTKELHMANAATLMKSLYFTELYSPGIRVFPWVLYHDENIQTRFMWFKGPNQPQTKESEIKMQPTAVSMKLLSKHTGLDEIKVHNDVGGDDIVLASQKGNLINIHVANMGDTRDVRIVVNKLTNKPGASYSIQKYLINSQNNNLFENADYKGRLQGENIQNVQSLPGNKIVLEQKNLAKHEVVFWELTAN